MKARKILLSLLTIVGVTALVIGASQAFFSDTETSTGNTFVAGAIDLLIDNQSYAIDHNIPGYQNPNGSFVASTHTSWTLRDLTVERFFDFVDLKPGDYGEDTISVHVNNNDAYVCAAAQVTEDLDNDITEPEEQDGDDGSDGVGELDEHINFAFWNDDGDNVYEDNETIFLQGPISAMGAQGSIALADATTNIWNGDGPVLGGATHYIGKYWCYGNLTPVPVTQDGVNTGNPISNGTGFTCTGEESINNQSQTDSVVGDLEFYAIQSRNNEQFSCSSWIPSFEPTLPKVGAALDEYVAPTCTTTVSGEQSIQTAVDGAAENSTVCVDETYTGSGDNVAIRIEILGLTLAATSQGVDLDVPVVLSNSNVTVTGFDGVIGQAESPAEQAAFYLDGDADGAEVSYNTVTGGVGAAVLTETGAALGGGLISNNVLSGATQGVYTNPHTGMFDIMYNDIYDNSAGIGGYTGAHVAYNHFSSAGEAIGADNSYDGSVVEFNNFLTGTLVNTYVGLTPDLSAPNNFWEDGAAAQTGGTDEVDFAPVAGSQYPHQ